MRTKKRQTAWSDLAASQQAAWFGFLRTHDQVVRELDQELQEAHGLPLTSYDVLVQLARAPSGQRQMWELAEAVVLTRSGLTRLVERLEREGLVERCRGEGDARQVFARITKRGHQRLRESSSTHVAGVRARFLDRLSPEQIDQLGGIWRQLLQWSNPTCSRGHGAGSERESAR